MDAPRHGEFTDVLRALDIKALETLCGCLRAGKCLHAARLAFRALRDAVDAGMRDVRLTLTEADADILQHPSPLRHWPRCSSVTVLFDRLGKSSLTPKLAAWPFGGLSAAHLQRITQLELIGAWMDLPQIEIVLATACNLPSLRQLILSETVRYRWAYVPATTMELMYSALAQSCPKLEHLAMPAGTELQGIGALAGSLQELEAQGRFQHGSASLIAELGQLKKLRLRYWAFCDSEGIEDSDVHGLVRFLNSLPPSVHVVQLQDATVMKDGFTLLISIGVRLNDSRIDLVALKKLDTVIRLDEMDCVSSLLLQAHALGPTLPVLEIANTLQVSSERLPGLRTNQPSFHQLLQRSTRVDLHSMALEGGEPEEMARQAVRLFGVPQYLRVCGFCIRLRLRGGQTEAGRPHGTVAAGPTPAGLQNGVLEAFCRGSSGQADVPAIRDAVVKEVLEGAIDRWRGDGRGSVVLLRGDPLSALPRGLARSNWVTQMSVRAVAVAAAEAAEAAPIASRTRGSYRPISSYLDSSAASDVILQCRSEKTAAAVEAVVRSYPEYASIEATLLSGFDATGEFRDRFSKVVQKLYDSSEGSEMERLERLMPLAEGLRVAIQEHRLQP